MGAAVYVSSLMGGKHEFGTWLARALRDAGISQAELGRRAGVSEGQLTRYRTGVTLPDPDTIKRLALALSADPDELLVIAGHREGDLSGPTTYVLRTKNPNVIRIAQIIEERAAKDGDITKAERLIETLFSDE